MLKNVYEDSPAIINNFVAKSAIWFSKNEGGGGVKAHLEFFWKFICFGTLTRPSALRVYFGSLEQLNMFLLGHLIIFFWVHLNMFLAFPILGVGGTPGTSPPPPLWLMPQMGLIQFSIWKYWHTTECFSEKSSFLTFFWFYTLLQFTKMCF